jgi:hypothetical protein
MVWKPRFIPVFGGTNITGILKTNGWIPGLAWPLYSNDGSYPTTNRRIMAKWCLNTYYDSNYVMVTKYV